MAAATEMSYPLAPLDDSTTSAFAPWILDDSRRLKPQEDMAVPFIATFRKDVGMTSEQLTELDRSGLRLAFGMWMFVGRLVNYHKDSPSPMTSKFNQLDLIFGLYKPSICMGGYDGIALLTLRLGLGTPWYTLSVYFGAG